MSVLDAEKKRVEAYVLKVARRARLPIPFGEIPGETPDFSFKRGELGIELSELLLPPSDESGFLPVEERRFREQFVRMAQDQYFAAPDAMPVHVNIYFADAKGKKQNKQQMSRSLAELVRRNAHLASPVVTLYNAAEGFASITIISEPERRDWWSGECRGYTLSDIPAQLAARIREKNERVPAYRANLANGAQVWLLVYSLVTVERSMSIPHGIEEWRFPFQFDRVFWFTCLEKQFAEIQRQ